MWYDQLLQDLLELQDESKAPGMSAYMRSQFPFLGVSRPERKVLRARHFAKPAAAIDKAFVELCFAKEEREYQYLAIDYLYVHRKLLLPEDLPWLKRLVSTKSWWDSVDGFPNILGDLALRHPSVRETMLVWSLDPDFWVRRLAILHQLPLKDRTDRDLLERILENNLGSREFFINKAIGWALRQFSKTDRGWVADFIERHKERMAPLSLREGSKYL